MTNYVNKAHFIKSLRSDLDSMMASNQVCKSILKYSNHNPYLVYIINQEIKLIESIITLIQLRIDLIDVKLSQEYIDEFDETYSLAFRRLTHYIQEERWYYHQMNLFRKENINYFINDIQTLPNHA